MGSGRRALAIKFAERRGFHFHDIDDTKVRSRKLTVRGVSVSKSSSLRDATMIHNFSKTTTTFPLLSRTYPDTVIESAFYRKTPRDFLLSEASKHFSKTIFVWIENEEAEAKKRITDMAEEGTISVPVGKALWRRRNSIENFEAFTPPVPVFKYAGISEETVNRLDDFVRSLETA